jgi:hypothetical protein
MVSGAIAVDVAVSYAVWMSQPAAVAALIWQALVRARITANP